LVARSSPCPSAPACAHRLIANPDGSATGICRADPPVCPQITFTPEEITPLELSWSKLGRAIAKAFELNFKLVDLPVPMTRQIGAWSSDAAPVILTIQTEPHNFVFAVGQLAARLRQKFILLAPTTRLVDVRCKEILANHGAELFALDATVIPTPQGTLLPVRSPGELFANFLPDPKDSVGEDVARQTLALAKALDAEHRFRKAPLYTVFLLYCSEGLMVKQIAKRCDDCHRSLIFSRLKLFHKKLGRHPAELRQYSAHFESIEQSLSDPRARNIYRGGAIDGDDGEDAS